MSGPALSTRSRPLETAVALQQSAFAAMLQARSQHSGTVSDHGSCGGTSRTFRGIAMQVRAVRTFVREVLAGHPAIEDAVLVASELASNAVAHSASGLDGGMFIVHLATVSATQAAVLVADQGSLSEPRVQADRPDAESGRGLAVVKGLSSALIISGHEQGMHSVLAVVPAASPGDRDGA